MRIPKLTVLVEAMPDAGGWAVRVTYARGGERRAALERQRGGARIFATLDAVARTLRAAGLAEFRARVKPS